MTETITIGITAFNAEATIEAAIRSALAQDWPDKDIVVVDDASTDGTVAIVQKMIGAGENLRLIRQDSNQGVAAARNVIIEAANGAFIAFFDDDDVSLPGRLTKQYSRIVAYERGTPEARAVICHTARRQKYPDDMERIEPTMGTAAGIAPHGPDVARRILYGRPVPDGFGSCAACSQMARRGLYRALGGFDPAFRRDEDTDLNIRIALAGGHFAGLAEPLVMQTMTLTGDKHLERERELMQALVDKYEDFLEQDGQYAFTQDWFDLKFDLLAGQTGLFLQKLAVLFCAHPVKTARRILWALPNAGFNLRHKAFHSQPSSSPSLREGARERVYDSSLLSKNAHPHPAPPPEGEGTCLITIGITCYNAANTIGRAIDSALAQDWPNKDIVVVDDMSTDDSVAVIESKIAGGAPLRLIRNPVNLGVAGASNRIIEEAKGEFIAFFDDDDESLPQRIRRQYETIIEHERKTGASQIACFVSGTRLYPNGHSVALTVPGTQPIYPAGEIMADYLLTFRKEPGVRYGGTPACAVMARRQTFIDNGLFDPLFRRNQDIDFCVRLALRGGHFIGCPDKLLIQHATQGSDKAADAEYAAWRMLIDKNKTYLESKHSYDYAKRWIRLRYMHFSRRPVLAALALADILCRYPVRGFGHFLKTGPGRLIHEFRMGRKR